MITAVSSGSDGSGTGHPQPHGPGTTWHSTQPPRTAGAQSKPALRSARRRSAEVTDAMRVQRQLNNLDKLRGTGDELYDR